MQRFELCRLTIDADCFGRTFTTTLNRVPYAMGSSLVFIFAMSATNCLTLSWSSSLTRRNTSFFWSINPPAAFGSTMFQCKTPSAKGNIGPLSLVVSQMVITWPNGSFNNSATLFVFWSQMSIPASFITSLAKGLEALRSTPHTHDFKSVTGQAP
jgi:hypothetical protein